MAVSLAMRSRPDERRPLSLMAGVAATRVAPRTRLKWPNDVLDGDSKVGGILVEQSAEVTVVGLGVNLWWADPPKGSGGLFGEDPGASAHDELGAFWGAELMDLLTRPDWPREEYLEMCVTVGRDITWLPHGSGRAVGVGSDGSLEVETDSGMESLHSGVVHHVR